MSIEKQINFQNLGLTHEDYFVDIIIDDSLKLKNFLVKKDVLPPEKVTAIYLAKWLFYNNQFYLNKKVLDLGSGTGIQGIVTGLSGAKEIIFSDLSKKAIENTKLNVSKFNLNKKSKIVVGDLFENINEKFDLIIFNHPFFPRKKSSDLKIQLATHDGGELLQRFLEEVKTNLKLGGIIVMPYFQLAGKKNDPFMQAPKHNFDVERVFYGNIKTKLHSGLASINILRLKK